MSDLIKNCENMILQVQDLLKQNTEWISRYAEYAEKINANMSIPSIISTSFFYYVLLFITLS